MVELLVVVTVVLALAAVAVPVSQKLRKEGERTRCLGNLRTIGAALEGYLADHNDLYPELELGRSSRAEGVPVLETVLAVYVDDPRVFHCPADREWYARSGSSYHWNSTQSGRHRMQTSFLGMNDRPDRVPLVLDKEAFHGGGNGVNMLYADYHISNQVEFRVGAR